MVFKHPNPVPIYTLTSLPHLSTLLPPPPFLVPLAAKRALLLLCCTLTVQSIYNLLFTIVLRLAFSDLSLSFYMPCKFLPVEPWKQTLKPAIGVQSIPWIGSAFAALFVPLLCIFLSWTFRLLLLQPETNR